MNYTTGKPNDKRKKVWGVYASKFREIVHINRERSKPHGEGVSAKFWMINGEGIKGYHSMEEALESRMLQQKAYRRGIAPKPGKFVMIYASYADGSDDYSRWDRHPNVYFGYKTEVAIAVGRKNNKEYREQYPGLIVKLRKMGLGFDADISDDRNFGFIGENLVSLDFGSESSEECDSFF